MKKFWIFILGVIVAIVGLHFLTKNDETIVDDNNQTQSGTITPGDTENVGSSGVTLNSIEDLNLSYHILMESSEVTYPTLRIFDDADNSLEFFTVNQERTWGCGPVALSSVGWYHEFTTFSVENKNYSLDVELPDGHQVQVNSFEQNNLETPLTVSATNFYVNGVQVADIEASVNGYYQVIRYGVIDLASNTVEINYMLALVEYGSTYQSTDGSIVWTVGTDNSSAGTVVDGTETVTVYSSFGCYGEAGFAAFQTSAVNYVDDTGYLKMIDWNTFSYNGITLTKTA